MSAGTSSASKRARPRLITKPSHNLAVAMSQFEGGRSRDGLFHPYWDAAGQCWTIGFGHIEGVTHESKSLTLQQARDLLKKDLAKKYAPAVAALHRLGKQKQFDAIVDAVYNLGAGVLGEEHTLGAALIERRFKDVPDALSLYVYAGGVRYEGLVRRRHWEGQLFEGGHYTL
jgi:lysozyme